MIPILCSVVRKLTGVASLAAATAALALVVPGAISLAQTTAATPSMASLIAQAKTLEFQINALSESYDGLRIQLSRASGLLRVQVTDDGSGGADPAQGTGLAGVERRLAAFDGILAVNSPPGGPTIVVIEVPCASSSQKTFTC